MMERNDLHIKRIRDELAFIARATGNIDKDIFLQDDLIQHAVSMSLISIGECANRLSDDFKEKNPEIEWLQIVAVRNIAAHGYWHLNMEQIWQAIYEDIPRLEQFFNKLV